MNGEGIWRCYHYGENPLKIQAPRKFISGNTHHDMQAPSIMGEWQEEDHPGTEPMGREGSRGDSKPLLHNDLVHFGVGLPTYRVFYDAQSRRAQLVSTATNSNPRYPTPIHITSDKPTVIGREVREPEGARFYNFTDLKISGYHGQIEVTSDGELRYTALTDSMPQIRPGGQVQLQVIRGGKGS